MTRLIAGLSVAAAGSGTLSAQGLDGRIRAKAEGRIGVSFAGRPDVCGNGVSYLRVGTGGFGNGETMVMSSGDGTGQCETGPIRVLLTRAGGLTVGVRVGAGAPRWPAGTADLGLVPGSEAARYFLAEAVKLDGRLGREMLLPAVLADSADIWRGLLDLTRNRTLSRGLRESAAGWIGRELAAADPAAQRTMTAELTRLALDVEEPSAVRTRAVSALAQADGNGTAALVGLADSPDPSVSRSALAALGRLSDPRARETLRRAAKNTALAEPARIEAIRALGGRDATGSDYAVLREIWASPTGAESRGNLLEALGEAGGAENLRWLLGVARDGSVAGQDRARAVRASARAGAPTTELIKLYDEGQDRAVKEALLETLFRIGDRASMDKLIAVAQTETDAGVRRSVVTRLAKTGDPRAKQVLKLVIEQ